MGNNATNESKQTLESCLKERLEIPRAVIVQLRETRPFNALIKKALEDIDYLLKQAENEK